MSDWKDDESEIPTCPDCGFEARSNAGLSLHRRQKHDWQAPPKEKAPGGAPRKTSRQEALRASLGIVALGVGMLDPYDGQVLTSYIPAQAAALDAAAKEYKWAEKVCEFLTMAGPVTMLSTAFLPPVFMILAHHRILPGPAAEGVARAMGGPQTPPSDVSRETPPAPAYHEDGSMTVAGVHFSAEEVQNAARAFVGSNLSGASEVIIGDNGAA